MAIAISKAPSRSERPVVPATLAIVAVGCLALGSYTLWRHAHDPQPCAYRFPAGLALLALAGAHVWAALRIAKGREATSFRAAGRSWAPHFAWQRPTPWLGSRRYWQWLITGCVGAYVLALCLGPDPGVAYVFFAACAGWHVALLAPACTVSPGWRGPACFRSRLARYCRQAAFVAAATFALAELAVRGVDACLGGRLSAIDRVQRQKLPPGAVYRGGGVNALGYWDREFIPARSGSVSRIAVLGGAGTLSGTAETNCLARLEERLLDVDVYNFGLREAGPREFAAQLAAEVAAYRPDLTVAILSVDDVAVDRPLPHDFDWRRLRLYQWARRAMPGWNEPRALPPAHTLSPDFETYLQASLPALALCRTPVEPAVEGRWRESLACLEDLAREAARRDLPLLLVLAPSEFQVNLAVRQALCRRAGCEVGQIDVEAPQRRWKTFADAHSVPVLDLLPHFRTTAGSFYLRFASEWNEQGHDLASRTLASWLQTRFGGQVAAK